MASRFPILKDLAAGLKPGGPKTQRQLLFAMAALSPLSLGTWTVLINNFAIERVHFTGVEIGILQSLREVPGFLAFTVIFVLLIVREQKLALFSLCLLGLGTAITGLLPSIYGLYFTGILMSTGFHYFETVNQSLTLQWLPKDEAPQMMGKLIAFGGFVSLFAYGLIFVSWKLFGLDFVWIYGMNGALTALGALYLWSTFPQFEQKIPQRRHIVLRKRYALYYALTFFAGARRQIFMVFAGFMLVEKFHYPVDAIAILFLVNCGLNLYVAPRIGRLIAKWGERRALTCEYSGLILIFMSYALVNNAWIAAGLYIVDHLLFAMAISMKTYFQKIADPADMAPTAGVAFSINHIAAVVIPTLFGLIWMINPAAVFITGAAMAACSLGLARLVPSKPEPGREIKIPEIELARPFWLK